MIFPQKKIYLVRHGETEWTLSGQHTGLTDIPLTKNGEQQAKFLGKQLHEHAFSQVYTSPLSRALKTCEIAGLAQNAKHDSDLMEWNYGDYEGMTSSEIWKVQPQWNIFSNGAPNGESISDIATRAHRVLTKIQAVHGDVILFSHGHFLRALATLWLQLQIQDGRLFALFPGSISILGFEKSTQVLIAWNHNCNFSARDSISG
jgi:probable phosphoglycerate mutase